MKSIIESLTSKLGANVGLDAGTSASFESRGSTDFNIIMGKAESGDFNITYILGSLTGGNALVCSPKRRR